MISINVLSSVIVSLTLSDMQSLPPPLAHTHSFTQSASFLFFNSKLWEEIAFRMKRKIYIFPFWAVNIVWVHNRSVSLCLNRGRLLSSATATPLHASMADWLYSRICWEDQKKKKEGGRKFEIRKSIVKNSCSSRIDWSPSAGFGVLRDAEYLLQPYFSPSVSLKKLTLLSEML